MPSSGHVQVEVSPVGRLMIVMTVGVPCRRAASSMCAHAPRVDARLATCVDESPPYAMWSGVEGKRWPDERRLGVNWSRAERS